MFFLCGYFAVDLTSKLYEKYCVFFLKRNKINKLKNEKCKCKFKMLNKTSYDKWINSTVEKFTQTYDQLTTNDIKCLL